jgi:hypothetical protein
MALLLGAKMVRLLLVIFFVRFFALNEAFAQNDAPASSPVVPVYVAPISNSFALPLSCRKAITAPPKYPVKALKEQFEGGFSLTLRMQADGTIAIRNVSQMFNLTRDEITRLFLPELEKHYSLIQCGQFAGIDLSLPLEFWLSTEIQNCKNFVRMIPLKEKSIEHIVRGIASVSGNVAPNGKVHITTFKFVGQAEPTTAQNYLFETIQNHLDQLVCPERSKYTGFDINYRFF